MRRIVADRGRNGNNPSEWLGPVPTSEGHSPSPVVERSAGTTRNPARHRQSTSCPPLPAREGGQGCGGEGRMPIGSDWGKRPPKLCLITDVDVVPKQRQHRRWSGFPSGIRQPSLGLVADSSRHRRTRFPNNGQLVGSPPSGGMLTAPPLTTSPAPANISHW